ncbi:C-X-C chemokine receptor type 6 [Hemicordylus capensis]|uniref:C-X-C chemokine receptor type 6 n=1 Tax=Hemicordylus capensis TaxID=884348 RepID=UPI00230430A8|nr:C-X-C chemokine receptor type 6 [Hemicordylus capensis]XP_053115573.1 C-X-C chemokine receptor type 6 [Hemicordylus capensis]
MAISVTSHNVTSHMPDNYDDYYYDNDNYNENFLAACRVFLVCMYSFTCIFGVFGNGLVLIILIFYQKVKMVTDIFLVSLATADLCFLCTLPFWAYTAAEEWIFGTVLCKIIRGFYTLNLYGSMLTLTCVTIDRYFAIVQATKAHISQAKRKDWGKTICILVWVISLAFALPQFIYSTQNTIDKSVCWTKYPSDRVALCVEGIQMVLGFFCPILVMMVCYSTIMNTLLKAKGFHKHKSLKIIFAIIMTFVLTQTPYNLLKLIRAAHRRIIVEYNFEHALIVTEAIAYFHSCLNPVLYFFIGAKFRKNLVRILKNIGCTKHQQIMEQWQMTEDDASKTYTGSHNVEETTMYPV